MSSHQTKKSALLIGYDPASIPDSATSKAPPGTDFKAFAQAIYDIEPQLIAAGYDGKSCLITYNIDEALQQATEALRSKKWDFVCIGGGVRLHSPTEVFEKFCNAVIENAPGAKLCFNDHPNTTVAAVKRWDI